MIRWFDKEKGFGFILQDSGERDLYVSITKIEPPHTTLDDGQRVEYEIVLGRKGPEAARVRPIG